ncbi:MAG: hypothetical protein KF691_00205 [Phycisphaeraceae bacterium]|nr:hypothetical protein [Phycisphaeraceae bacterium]
MPQLLTLNLAAIALVLVACDQKQASAPSKAPTATSPAAIPSEAFLAVAPADAKPVKDVKAVAKSGEKVTVVGRIGMGDEPFVKDRAVFTIVDLGVKYCGEETKDSCHTPWDYCCEPSDVLAANSATIQFINGNGQPLRTELNGVHGLKPLTIVSVVGTVAEGTGNSLVINADSVYVKP